MKKPSSSILLLIALMAISLSHASARADFTDAQWTDLLHRLGSNSFKTRDHASNELAALDIADIPELKKYIASTKDEETKSRLAARLAELQGPPMVISISNPAVVSLGDPFTLTLSFKNTRPTIYRAKAEEVHLEFVLMTGGLSQIGDDNHRVPLDLPISNGEFTIPPSSQIDCKVSLNELSVRELGPCRATFVIDPLRERERKPNEFEAPLYYLWFEVVPSDLLKSLWNAKTDAERAKVQVEFNALLKNVLMEHHGEGFPLFDAYLRHSGGYAIPYFEAAAHDPDPELRRDALTWFPYAAWATDCFNTTISPAKDHPIPTWAEGLTSYDEKVAIQKCLQAALTSLKDSDASVREIAVIKLRQMEDHEAITPVTAMLKDPDLKVRIASVQFLGLFREEKPVALILTSLLNGPDETLRIPAMMVLHPKSESPH